MVRRLNIEEHQKNVYNICDDCKREMSILEELGYCARCDKDNLCNHCCFKVRVAHYYIENATADETFCSECSQKLNILFTIGSDESNEINRKQFAFKPKRGGVKKTHTHRFWQDNFRNDVEEYRSKKIKYNEKIKYKNPINLYNQYT